MASNEVISEIIDPKALRQVDELKQKSRELTATFNETIAAAERLNTATGRSTSFRQYNQNAQQSALANERLAQAQNNTARSAVQLEAAQSRLAQSQQTAAQQTVANNQRIQESEARTEAIRRRSAESTERSQQQIRLSEEQSERQRQTFEQNQRRRAEAAALRAERERQRAERESTPYQLLTRRLKDLETQALNTGAVFGANSRQYQLAAARVRAVRAEVDALEQPIGRFQRNVGNYGGALVQYASKAFNFLRVAANILPGLGLSGILLLGFEGLKALSEQLGLFTNKATAAQTANKVLVESIGSTEYQKAVSNVSELRRNIDLARQGFLDKDKVVNQYNETIGKTTGQVSSLDQAEQALNKNANNYIRFTFLKAVANTALQKSAELAAQAAADALKNPADNREFGDYGKVLVDNDTKAQSFTTRLKGYANTLRNTFAGAGLATLFADTFGGKKLVTEQAADRLKKNSKDLMDQSNIQKRIFDDFEAQAARLAKENGFNFFQDNSSASGSQALQQRLQAVNALIEAEKRRNDLVQENDKSSYDERIQSSKQFLETTTELINKRKEIELTAEKLTNDGRKAIRQSALNDVKAANIQSLKEQQKVNDEIDAELKKTYDSQIALAKEKDRQTIESLKSATEQQIELINSNRNAAVLALEEQRATGEISEADYQQQLTDIEFQATQDRLQLQIDTAKRIIEIRRAAGQDVGNEEKALADLQIKIDNSVTEERIKNLQKYAQARKDLQKLELQLAQEAANLIASIVNAGFENRKNEIQDQKDKLTEQTKNEVEAVSRSLGSEEEKADKIAIINARAKAKQDQLDAQSRKVQQEQAKFERALNIARVIQATATAEVQALSYLSNPLTAALYPAIAATIAAIGAAQIATILATPIPKYAKGTRDHPGGLGIVGDAGIEYVRTPDGNGFFTPNSPTLLNMPKHTEVISNKDLVRMMGTPRIDTSARGAMNIDALIKEQRSSTRELSKNFKQQQHTYVTGKGVKKTVNNGTSWTNYIGRNI